jgi:hypothetical protein
MKELSFLVCALLATLHSFGQSTATLRTKAGVKDAELQHVLYFEGISYQKFAIKSGELKGKNFALVITEFKEGKSVRVDTVFNSREDEYFRLKSDSLVFSTLTKMSDDSEFKIQFQFNGFSSARKYKVLPSEKEKFTLKGFHKTSANHTIKLNEKNYLLAYMMPFVRPDKSEAYCEVAQSGLNPETLYDKYKIPHYFLVQLRFK